MVIVAMMHSIPIAMAMQVAGAIGLLLTVAHHQRSAARQQRYEHEIAQDAGLRAVARATVDRYRLTGPQNSTPTAQ